MAHTNNLLKIIYEESPDILTDRDAKTLEAQEELEQLYGTPPEPPSIEEILAEILQAEDSSMPGDTVEQEILDGSNILYSVEGIDTIALSETLALHKQARGIETPLKDITDAELLKRDRPDMKIIETELTTNIQNGRVVKEKWGQTNDKLQHNFPLEMIFDGSILDAEAQEQSLDDYIGKSNTYYIKREKLMLVLRTKLKNAWKEYRYRQQKKATSVNQQRIQANQNLSNIYNDIKRYQHRIERVEKAEHDAYRKQVMNHRHRQADPLLDKFVDYQQAELAAGRDPQRTRADVVAKYPKLKRPLIPVFEPKRKKDKELNQLS